MENQNLAKSEPIKTIKEHTDDLLRQYQILKSKYANILKKEEWKTLEDAIKYHDLGKLNSKFQNKLYEKLGYTGRLKEWITGEEVPHNFLSPFFIDTKKYKEKYGEKQTKLLVSSVYYHHSREQVPYNIEEVKQDLQEQIKSLPDFYQIDIQKVRASFNRYVLLPNEHLLQDSSYIKIKGLLNKIDYIASLDKVGVNIEEDTKEEGKGIKDKMISIIESKYSGNYREVQKYMKEHCEENIIVISSCGTGKTEAALLWTNNQKTFYTLPLKVSINAIYQRITQQIGYHKAVLLHSDAFSYYLEKEGSNIMIYDRAKRFTSPFIITTADQLFKIVFRYCGYEEILATLSYSKVVIDEIQMYTPEIVAYILLGLKMITNLKGKFAIMTATFPPMLYSFIDALEIPYTRQREYFQPNIDNKHKIELKENADFDLEKIKKQAKENKVLVICNTIKKAQMLYDKLKDANIHLLHSHYIKQDRNELEKEILEFSDKSKHPENGIWISTQIVEASLDIDFDILHTDMCSIDSLFQRMGRVYRKREYTKEEPNIYIYDNKNGVPIILHADIYRFSLQELLKYNGKTISEKDKQNMIENIFDETKNKELIKSDYYKKIQKTIEIIKKIKPYEIEKKEVNKLFRNISSISLLPDCIYEKLDREGKIEVWTQILKTSRDIKEKIKVKNEIQKYTINVSNYHTLHYDKEELFFPYSNIHRTDYQYEFNEKDKKGRGLIMQGEDNIL